MCVVDGENMTEEDDDCGEGNDKVYMARRAKRRAVYLIHGSRHANRPVLPETLSFTQFTAPFSRL